MKNINKNQLVVFILILVFFVPTVFLSLPEKNQSSIYFLDVGQGDSEFINISGVDILIDGGPVGGGVMHELSKAMSPFDRYIDLIIMTHPQADHFGGLIDVFKRYKVGAFMYNGEKGDSSALKDLEKAISDNGSKIIKLQAGDRIKYKNSVFTVLSPNKKINDLNEASLVLKLQTNGTQTLFTGDIGEKIEELIKNKVGDIHILKVAHHGSKYSSSASFLNAVDPEVSVIEVGGNSYGHPHNEVINKLRKINSRVYRTDLDGTVKIKISSGTLDIFTSS
ncbi:MAG TPA: MBL fold metallo-hydrolase [Candidatus Paceibacterota bacterium]|nr:MBL fold metallo-hydrolase [Candidatus Paceibacterota bacterium]